ncbi:MAG TPA: ATP-binding protein, partial [Candidatus Paceibacterota bacterium]
VSIVTSYLGYYIIKGKRDFTSYCFAFLIISICFWAYGLGFFSIVQTEAAAMVFVKMYYIAAAGIPLFFWLFSMSFPKNRRVATGYQVGAFALFVSLCYAIILKDGFIIESVIMTSPKGVVISIGSYVIYGIYIVGVLVWAYVNLVRSYLKFRTDPILKGQLKFMILGTIVPYIFGVYFNLLLPVYNYTYVWAGPIFGLALVMIILYAVFKQRLFDTKIITVELFTFTLWLFIFLRALIANDTSEQIGNFFLLIPTIIIGIFLIRSVREEIKARKQIEKLAANLEEVNRQLIKLDDQKSEFVSLASHQLRGPLAAIKGYSSMVLEGDFGETNPAETDAVQKIFESAQGLVTIVGDYLDVSSIEQGKMQYDFTVFDIRDLVEEVTTQLTPNIEKAGLSFAYNRQEEGLFLVNGDYGKIKQVISNLMDNAIKYTPQGGISVDVRHNSPKTALVTIKDTGVGIHPEVLPHLFAKYSRAPDASKTNIMGTGLGLYVAKKMIEAHHGRIWAESAGQDKGSMFRIELELLGKRGE